MSLTVTTPPEIEPISLESAKVAARVRDSEEDDHIEDELIPTARELVESYLGRTLITTEYELRLPCFPCDGIVLPKPPLQSVESVSYVAPDGTIVEMDEEDYRVFASGVKPRILPPDGGLWPSTQSGNPEAVTVAFTCGYGDAPDDVPHRARSACRRLVALWHREREPVLVGAGVAELPLDVKDLLSPLKIWEA